MDKDTYQEALGGIERERTKVRNRLEKAQKRLIELEGDAEALRRAWALLTNEPLQDNVHADGNQPRTFAEARQTASRGGLIDRVQQIVESLDSDSEFTSETVRRLFEEIDPELYRSTHKSSIPGALSQLVGKKALVLVSQGAGRRYSRYRRPHEVGGA